MTVYVSRAGWGARAPSGSGNAISSHPLGSAVHWNGPGMGLSSHSECTPAVQGIQRFHMDTNGWSDIAYNLLCCPHDTVYEGRGRGRGSAANGSTQANKDWYAVMALVGEGDPQPSGLYAAVSYATGLVRSWGAGSAVCGHRDLYGTECPGATLYGLVTSGAFGPGGGDWEDDVMGDVSITGITNDAAQVISKATWERYSPGGKNLATHLGEIGQNVAWLTEAIQAVAARTGTKLSAPPPPLPDDGGPDGPDTVEWGPDKV